MVQLQQSIPQPTSADRGTPQAALLVAARQGEAEAIAHLLQHSLRTHHIQVQGQVQEHHLSLSLESQSMPPQEHLMTRIQQGIQRLQVPDLQTVTVRARPSAQHPVAWESSFAPKPVYGRPIRQRDEHAEELIRVHVAGNLQGQQIAIGHHITQVTNHGVLVYPDQDSKLPAKPQPKRRPAPNLHHYCKPFPDLLDRTTETRMILDTLPTQMPIEVHGEAGIGKSVLLRHLAHQPQVAQPFPDGVVYHAVRQQPAADVAQFLFEVFYDYDFPIAIKPTEPELREALAHCRALAVLDDIAGDKSQVEDILSLPGLSWLLAASEDHLWGEGVALPLQGLPLEQAMELVERGLGRSLQNEERTSAQTLCQLLHGHPLRILQNVAAIRSSEAIAPTAPHRTLAKVVAQLQKGRTSETITLQATRDLPTSERRSLAIFALFGSTPVSLQHLQVLTADANIDMSLQTLVERGLVWSDGAQYSLASNLQAPLAQLWDLSGWIEPLLRYFIEWGTEQEAATLATSAHQELLSHLVEIAVQHQQWSDALQLCQLLDVPIFESLHWGLWQQIWEMGLEAAEALGNEAIAAYASHQLGTHALCLGDTLNAYHWLVQAVQQRQELGDPIGAAVSQHNLNLLLLSPPPPPETEAPSSAPPPSSPPGSPLPWKALIGLGLSITAGVVGAIFLLPGNPELFTVQPEVLTFAAQPLEEPSPPQTLTVQNTSDEPLFITSVGIAAGLESDFTVTDTCLNSLLFPNDRCTVSVGFQPMEVGDRRAQLVIEGEHGAFERTVFLQGEGIPRDENTRLSFSPANFAFEPTPTNPAEPPTQPITLQNTGRTTITLDRIALVDNEADAFVISDNPCTGTSLRPDTTCTITLQFLPPDTAEFQAILHIEDTTQGMTWEGELTGLGQLPPPQIEPTDLLFDDVPIGTTSRRTVTLRNLGRSPLRIANIDWSEAIDGLEIVNQTCQDAIPPGESCEVQIQFSPRNTGDIATALRVSSNAIDTPQQIPISGSSQLSPPPILSPLDFGEQRIGTAREATLTLTNPGPAPLRIQDVALAPSEHFAIVNDACRDTTLGPDRRCSIQIRFAPETPERHAALLTITDSAAGSPRTTPIRGTGVAIPPPEIVRLSLETDVIEQGDRTELCYATRNATRITLRTNSESARTLNAPDDCLIVSPRTSTSYELTALNAQGATTQASVRLDVMVPDTTPPPIPQGIAPPSGASLCELPSVLRWSNVTDPSSPVRYRITIERQRFDERQNEFWETMQRDIVSEPQLGLSQNIVESSYRFRWHVSAIDQAGNESAPSPWYTFMRCIPPVV